MVAKHLARKNNGVESITDALPKSAQEAGENE
jgi:hypothetical protein